MASESDYWDSLDEDDDLHDLADYEADGSDGSEPEDHFMLGTFEVFEEVLRIKKLPTKKWQNFGVRLGNGVIAEWAYLSHIVARHEATIRARWKKKSPAKRRELLSTVFPGIPDRHRPDVVDHSFCGENCTCQEPTKGPSLQSQLWPYINLEDLSDSKHLLVFINSRARYHPTVFAGTELAFSRMAPNPNPYNEFHPKLRMILLNTGKAACPDGQTDPKFGTIVSFESESEALALDRDRSGIVFGLGQGFWILCIQLGILRFIKKCCEVILHDIDVSIEAIENGPFPVVAEPPSLLDHGDLRSSFADEAKLLPYRVRDESYTARLRQLISTVLENAKDHVWALREDPAYFAECFQIYRDHRFENVADEYGNPYPHLGSRKFVRCVLTGILADTYYHLIAWDQIHQQLIKLEAIQASVMDAETGDEAAKLPDIYFDTAQVIYWLLSCQKQTLANQLQSISRGSPQLRHMRIRIPIPGTNADRIEIRETDDAVGVRVRKLLHFAYTTAMSKTDTEGPQHWLDTATEGPQRWLDCLETYTQKEPSARQKISPLTERVITPFSICVEGCFSLRASRVHAKISSEFDYLDKNPIHPHKVPEFAESLFKWRLVMANNFKGLVAPNLGDPSDGKFDYPDEDPNSKEVVEARCKAERNLDKFWRHTDNALRKVSGYAQHEVIRRIFDEGGPMRRTLTWKDDTHSQMTKTRIEYEYVPLSEAFHDASKEITGSFDRAMITSKSKEKTRGEGVDPDNPAVADQVQQHEPATKDVFRVDKDSFVVFKALFYSPNDGELPRSIRWNDVVNALTKVGFAAEKLHGSAWQFTPKKIKLDRGIQFHEPHPDDEVPLWLARRYGRRLARAYGWEGSMFKRK